MINLSPIHLGNNVLDTKITPEKSDRGFSDVLKNALNEVNDLQIEADKSAVNFTLGNPNVDVHDVMINMEKAQLALSLTIEIRNKLVESYQEIMRMQV